MSLSKRGGVYWFEFVYRGERFRRSTKVGNQRGARQIEAAFRTALAMGDVGITERKPAPTFSAAMQSFLAWSKEEHQAHPNTAERYRYSSAALLRFFGDAKLDSITPDDVERFKTTRASDCKTVRGEKNRVKTNKQLRPATVNRELACLKALFNFVIKGDVVVKNPVSRVKMLAENNLQTRVLSFTEQHSYLAKATPVLRDVATMIIETGMRPEEIFTIQPVNVHIADGFLKIQSGKTPAARRRINLTAAAQAVLRARLATNPEHYLFPCETDATRPLPNVHGAHHRAVANSKVKPFRLYDLRHTWATRAAESGIDLVTLASMLGHSRIQMVLRYAHPGEAHQAQAMSKLEAFNAAQQIAEYERQGAVVQ